MKHDVNPETGRPRVTFDTEDVADFLLRLQRRAADPETAAELRRVAREEYARAADPSRPCPIIRSVALR